MKHRLLLILACGCFSAAFAQTSSRIDSLLLINRYLLEIKDLVNGQYYNGEERYHKAVALAANASAKDRQFKRLLKHIVPASNPDHQEMAGKMSWILQSLVLYKTDLKENNFRVANNNSEAMYLNRNIPILVNKIYFHRRRTQESFKIYPNKR